MVFLVTGAAGFIGSHLCDALLARGDRVIGVDCFLDFCPRETKEARLSAAYRHSAFKLIETDLITANFAALLDGVDVIFHLAAQPGVRSSWGESFHSYVENNIIATQRLLEAVAKRSLRKFVFASSSSIYGDATELPLREQTIPQPISPYGVTKLAAEHLCSVYHSQWGVPAIALRYFTVYGPRQRPDMAFHQWIRALLSGETVTIFGDGKQTRDFTFVADIVRANLLAAECSQSGVVANIAGGSRVTVLETVRLLEEITGAKGQVSFVESAKGDVRDTWADTTRAREVLGFTPQVSLADGLAAQVRWMQEQVIRNR